MNWWHSLICRASFGSGRQTGSWVCKRWVECSGYSRQIFVKCTWICNNTLNQSLIASEINTVCQWTTLWWFFILPSRALWPRILFSFPRKLLDLKLFVKILIISSIRRRNIGHPRPGHNWSLPMWPIKQPPCLYIIIHFLVLWIVLYSLHFSFSDFYFSNC